MQPSRATGVSAHVSVIRDVGYAAAGSVCGSASGTRRSAAARTTGHDVINCLKTCRLVSKSLVYYYTRYGLDGPGIEPGEARFSAPVRTGPGAHPASCTVGKVKR